jgi:L-amino acid N-acyltransferase
MDVIIRAAAHDDLPSISAIYNDAVATSIATFDTEKRSIEDQEKRFYAIHSGRHPILIAEARNSVVGWVSLSPWSDRPAYDNTAEISTYIHKNYRDCGIGFRLKAAMLEQAKILGFHCIISRVAGDNKASCRLNQKLGFDFIGTMKEVGKKFGRLHDVHLYQLIIGSSCII